MKILNLYAGLGGNRLYWRNCEVTAVELNPKIAKVYSDQHPEDKMVIGDAHQYLHDHYMEFDFIWSSPPCQSHSRMVKATRHNVCKYPDMALYQEIILLKEHFKGMWVVENVKPYYHPLIGPSIEIGRHIFWTNFDVSHIESPDPPVEFITAESPDQVKAMKNWLGIQYEGNIYYDGNHSPGQVLRNCVHPVVGRHVFECSKGLFYETNHS